MNSFHAFNLTAHLSSGGYLQQQIVEWKYITHSMCVCVCVLMDEMLFWYIFFFFEFDLLYKTYVQLLKGLHIKETFSLPLFQSITSPLAFKVTERLPTIMWEKKRTLGIVQVALS